MVHGALVYRTDDHVVGSVHDYALGRVGWYMTKERRVRHHGRSYAVLVRFGSVTRYYVYLVVAGSELAPPPAQKAKRLCVVDVSCIGHITERTTVGVYAEAHAIERERLRGKRKTLYHVVVDALTNHASSKAYHSAYCVE